MENKLRSFNDLVREMANKDNIQYLDPDTMVDYHAHKYERYTTQKYMDLLESVKTYGIIQPVIARNYGNKVEILAGHNRRNAGREAGILIPTIIVDADDDLADDIVNITNLHQRAFDELSLSQQAAILQGHIERLKKQGKMQNFVQSIEDKDEGFTRDLIAKDYGLSGRSISRKLRINYLINDFKEQVDHKKLSVKAAVELSFLDDDTQMAVLELADENGIKINGTAAQRLHSTYEKDELDEEAIEHILLTKKEEPKLEIDLMTEDELRNYLEEKIHTLPIWFRQKFTGEIFWKIDIEDDLSIVYKERTYINASGNLSETSEKNEWCLYHPKYGVCSEAMTLEEIITYYKERERLCKI